MTDRLITPVILSGGSGTRLWPLSREERPKQLLPLVGPETMLQMTARRVADRSLFAPPVVVANERHANEIEAQLAAVGTEPARLFLEPCARNTAAAIALAALSCEPDDLLLVMPSDHVIARPELFIAAVRSAIPVAEQGWLITFGISPDRPETGYGYIRRGGALAEGVFAAEAFVEKPDATTAANYLASGRYSWNGGIFLFRADSLLEQLGQHDSEILAGSQAAVREMECVGTRLQPGREAFTATPSRSIDHAVMEKAKKVAVVPVDMGWSDVGSWDALYEIKSVDAQGNALSEPGLSIDSKGCLVHSNGPFVATIGLEDLIIIATPDAVLIMPRGESQRVKEVVDLVRKAPPADGASRPLL